MVLLFSLLPSSLLSQSSSFASYSVGLFLLKKKKKKNASCFLLLTEASEKENDLNTAARDTHMVPHIKRVNSQMETPYCVISKMGESLFYIIIIKPRKKKSFRNLLLLARGLPFVWIVLLDRQIKRYYLPVSLKRWQHHVHAKY